MNNYSDPRLDEQHERYLADIDAMLEQHREKHQEYAGLPEERQRVEAAREPFLTRQHQQAHLLPYVDATRRVHHRLSQLVPSWPPEGMAGSLQEAPVFRVLGVHPRLLHANATRDLTDLPRKHFFDSAGKKRKVDFVRIEPGSFRGAAKDLAHHVSDALASQIAPEHAFAFQLCRNLLPDWSPFALPAGTSLDAIITRHAKTAMAFQLGSVSEKEWAKRKEKFWGDLRVDLDTYPISYPEPPRALLQDPPNPPALPVEKWREIESWPSRRLEWPWEVLQRVFCSPEERGQERVFLGLDTAHTGPLFVDRKALHAHTYIWGPNESGKTSGAILPLSLQLLRGSDDETGEPPPMLVIDLKGDNALYHSLRLEAARRGCHFHTIALDSSRKSDYFDVFENLDDLQDPQSLSDLLCQGFELEHGAGYGAGFFSDVHADELAEALAQPSKPRTWDDLVRALPKKRQKEASHLLHAIRPLTRDPLARILRPPDDADASRRVNFGSVVRERRVVYLTVRQGQAGRQDIKVARLALWCFLHALSVHKTHNGRERRGYAVIDEFQKLAGANVIHLLEQCRGIGLSLVLSNQSPFALDGPNLSLSKILLHEANLKICLGIGVPEEIDYWKQMSGETVEYLELENRSRTTSRQRGTSWSSGTTDGRGANWGTAISEHASHGDSLNDSFGPHGFVGSRGSSKSTGHGSRQTQGYSSTFSKTRSEGGSSTEGESETIGHRMAAYFRSALSSDDVLDVSSRQLQALVMLRNDSGSGGRPQAVKLLYAMPEPYYRLVSSTPLLPRPHAETPEALDAQQSARDQRESHERGGSIRGIRIDDDVSEDLDEEGP